MNGEALVGNFCRSLKINLLTFFFSLALAGGLAYGAPPPLLTFDQALKKMTATHPDVLVEKTKLNQAGINLSGKKLNFLPHASFSGSQSEVPGSSIPTTNSVAVNANVNLFRAGSDVALVNAAGDDLESEKNVFLNTELTSEFQSAQILVAFIASRQKINILKSSVDTFETALKIAHESYGKGLLPLQEADKASVDLNNALARLSDASTEEINAGADVVRLLGPDGVETQWPWKVQLPLWRKALLLKSTDQILQERPDYRALVNLRDAEHERSVSASRLRFPSLDLAVSYGTAQYIGGPWNLGSSTTLNLTMPFFDALQNQSTYRVQLETEVAAEIKLHQLERDIGAQVKSAADGFDVSVTTAVAREQTLEISRRLYQINQRRLKQGRASANEVALDQARLTDSELLALQGWAAAHNAFVNFCHSRGKSVQSCPD